MTQLAVRPAERTGVDAKAKEFVRSEMADDFRRRYERLNGHAPSEAETVTYVADYAARLQREGYTQVPAKLVDVAAEPLTDTQLLTRYRDTLHVLHIATEDTDSMAGAILRGWFTAMAKVDPYVATIHPSSSSSTVPPA